MVSLPRKLARAQRKILRLADLIHQRQLYVRGNDPLGRLVGLLQRTSVAPFEQVAFKGFAADEKCTQCGWCVNHCPVRNITMTEQGVQFEDDCIICMRCYNFCPVQAIQSTDATRNTKKYRRYKGPEGKPRF